MVHYKRDSYGIGKWSQRIKGVNIRQKSVVVGICVFASKRVVVIKRFTSRNER